MLLAWYCNVHFVDGAFHPERSLKSISQPSWRARRGCALKRVQRATTGWGSSVGQLPHQEPPAFACNSLVNNVRPWCAVRIPIVQLYRTSDTSSNVLQNDLGKLFRRTYRIRLQLKGWFYWG